MELDRSTMTDERESASGTSEACPDKRERRAPRGLSLRRLFASLTSPQPGKSPFRIKLAAWGFLAIYGIIAAKLLDFGLRPEP
ncbi:MAG TPA: hypothetical protein VFF88_11465, partial [Methylocella sp.]|nr:hypothetical protein [Methylocella sp.]